MARVFLSHKNHTIRRRCDLWILPPYLACDPCEGFALGLRIDNGQRMPLSTTLEAVEVRWPGESRAIVGHPGDVSDDGMALPLRIENPALGSSRELRFLFRIPKGVERLELRIAGHFSTQSDTEAFDCTTSLELADTGFQYVGPGARME